MAENEVPLALHKAIEYEQLHKVEILLPVTKNVNQLDENGDSALILACQKKNEIIELLLNDDRVDINAKGADGFTALHYLALYGKLWALEKILSKNNKVDINVETDTNDTPLILAAKKGHAEVIKFLLEKGAVIDHQNNKGCSALMYACNGGHFESSKLLIKYGADVNLRNTWEQTPLMKVSQWGYEDVCQLLLENGAGVNLTCNYDKTALTYACHRNQLNIAKLLVQRGADVNHVSFRTDGNIHMTPLIGACYSNNPQMVSLLLENGAQVNYPGSCCMALLICQQKQYYECAELLLKAGATPP